MILETILKTTGIKTGWHWHKNIHIDQWDRIEGPEIHSHACGQLIYNKRSKSVLQGKGSLFHSWGYES